MWHKLRVGDRVRVIGREKGTDKDKLLPRSSNREFTVISDNGKYSSFPCRICVPFDTSLWQNLKENGVVRVVNMIGSVFVERMKQFGVYQIVRDKGKVVLSDAGDYHVIPIQHIVPADFDKEY